MRDSRIDPNRVLFVGIVVFLLVFFLNQPTQAGETEHKVITDNFDAWGTTVNFQNYDTEMSAPFLAEGSAIWNDTATGSYCEVFAAIVFVMMDATDKLFLSEGADIVPAIYISSSTILLDEYDQVAKRCLNE